MISKFQKVPDPVEIYEELEWPTVSSFYQCRTDWHGVS